MQNMSTHDFKKWEGRLFSLFLLILNKIYTKLTKFILEILVAWGYIPKNKDIIVFFIQ